MRIAINGAGIAGPAFAHWMHRTGHDVTLIEQAAKFRTGGYLIDFWGLGYSIAQKMGIEKEVLAAGYRIKELRSVRADGSTSARLNVDPIRRMTEGRYTSVARGDLAAAIYRTVEDDIETIYSDTITAIDDRADCVSVEFEHSAPRDFDLVIGADGLHSTVRRLAFGAESASERYLGCHVAACVIDGYRPRDELVYLTHNLPGRQVGRASLGDDRTMILFIFRAPTPRNPPDLESCKDLLRNEFAGGGWECAEILEALDQAEDLYFDVVSQIRLDRWTSGRVALIGDAAACVSLLAGEGTGLAMVEAYVLAGELARAGGDLPQAFAAYEDRLRQFITQKQDSAIKFIPFFVARSRPGIWFRNLGMRAMNLPIGNLVLTRALRDDLDLPDYDL
ncbi:FAD-binding domain [Mycolicibacterium tusciae]|uniref:FAD-binding domain n=1 Tax=Mycolicibacterium tusciae TaxID=75922 RepID=UPI00024A2644|nr:FAD-binding domain [Mycolicibacterium tusciae]